MRFSSFSIIIVFVGLMFLGLAMLPRLGVQLHPSAHLPELSVQFTWHGAPALNIEREVSSRLEAGLSRLAHIKEVESVSSQGSGRINLRFHKNVDPELARFEISSRIRQIFPDLPQGVSYPSVSVSRAVGRRNPILSYSVNAPESSLVIQQYLEQVIIPSLSRLHGVDHVVYFGLNPMEYEVVFDVEKLAARQIHPADISVALQNSLQKHYVGSALESNCAEKGTLSVILKAGTSAPLQDIVLGNYQGRILYLKDVARVEYRESIPTGYYRINGQTTMQLSIYAAPGENQIRLADRILENMQYLQSRLPRQWQLMLTYNDTEIIRKDLRRVGLRMLFSFAILMVFVILVSRNIRYVFLILTTVVANILMAVIFYHLLDLEIHLYSLAGITVSFGIIIDNSIVMVEHLRHHRNKKVFLAILAATLTTAGSLSVIFMLNAVQQAQLSDFAGVVLVNLLISLLVAWFFIPALYSRLHGGGERRKTGFRRSAILVFNTLYLKWLVLTQRFRWMVLLIALLALGIPVHLLPSKVEEGKRFSGLYNASLGSAFYQRKAKNYTEKILGGSWRLFSRYVYEKSYFSDPERTVLYVRGQMPDGASVHQLNDAILQMEEFLTGFPQLEVFQTRVSSHSNGFISIMFRPEYDNQSFPHIMQAQITRKAIDIGGAEWNVWGVGRGFSNVLGSQGGSNAIIMEGYNYDQLYRYARAVETKALQNPRINKVNISGADLWNSAVRMEFYMQPAHDLLALYDMSLQDLFQAMNRYLLRTRLSPVLTPQGAVPLTISSNQAGVFSLWDLHNTPIPLAGEYRKIGDWAAVDKRPSGNDIYKFNQQYRLIVSYDFLGPSLLAQRVTEGLAEEAQHTLPLGYTATIRSWNYGRDSGTDYTLILLVIVIIYFVCAILLESLLQPLAIIGLIPISFVGLFLTFYAFDLNFDQGGLAAFILLSGLSVNAGLYILNDYNNFRKQFPGQKAMRLYAKAFRYKIIPVLLTIGSTIIGLIPFVAGQKEAFWFAFAAGTMGGLVFSLVGVVLFFPAFLGLGRK